jgi:hypothetical protein
VPRRPSDRRRRQWARLGNEDLLDVRLCDLDLRIEGTWLEEPIARVGERLAERELRVRPHYWLSEEFFSPGDIPGVALPFYLAHPRLIRLERKMMLWAEGAAMDECLKILRHELGHVVQHAYQLQRRRTWRQLFGASSTPYPDHYQPRPRSKRFVQHLELFYAQSHPDEDFAETFAVWLGPAAQWRKRYETWPALRKLEYVDELMHSLRGQKPVVFSRRRIDPLRRLTKTLRTYYDAKRARFDSEHPDSYDRDLRRLFSDDPRHRKREAASAFLRRVRPEVREMVSTWTGEYEFTLDQVLKDMIGRCRDLGLRVAKPERQLKIDFAIYLTVQTLSYFYDARHVHPL